MHSRRILTLFGGFLAFVALVPAEVTAATYTFEGDTIGATPAGVTVGAGTFDVQDDDLLGKSMRAVTQVGVIAAVNFDNFASTTDQSVVWKQSYSNNLGRGGFTLRAQSADTSVVNSVGAKMGYLFHVYDANSVYIWRVGESAYTALWSGSLSKAEPRWFKAIAVGNELGFYYSDDGTSYTRIASTTDATYASGKVQYTAGYGAPVNRDYVDDIVITNLAVDVTAPTLTGLSPADNATDTDTSADLVLTFDEAVDVETGNIHIYKSSDDSLVESLAVDGAQVTGSGTAVITVNPSLSLADMTSYYVLIDATAFDDTSGNSFAGIADSTTWNFTTGDDTNPVILSTSPVDNATGVSVTTNLSITFDEPVDIESGSIYIIRASNPTIVETIDVTGGQVTGTGTNTITIDPSVELEPGTEYYILIAASAFDDASGNSFAGIVSDTSRWTFTTATGDEVEEETPRTGGGISAKQRTLNRIERYVSNNDMDRLRQYVLDNKDRIARYHERGTELPEIVVTLLGLDKQEKSQAEPVAEVLVLRDLFFGTEGEDVKKLQKLLIQEQYAIPAGATGYFGLQTQYALDAYQVENGVVPRGGYFGPITRAQMKVAGLPELWW